ncbi:hypothetical protein ABIA99_005269 [Bradyrhizobium sp. LB12.1]|uniref:hypothetical protein n=1 Tax=Bradyrhizobium sp. LB12.1 TaxID=3156327 RepID=UPI00339533C0
MTERDKVALGREAWQRIRARGEKTFADWVLIGKALAIGRAECLRIAGSKNRSASATSPPWALAGAERPRREAAAGRKRGSAVDAKRKTEF